MKKIIVILVVVLLTGCHSGMDSIVNKNDLIDDVHEKKIKSILKSEDYTDDQLKSLEIQQYGVIGNYSIYYVEDLAKYSSGEFEFGDYIFPEGTATSILLYSQSGDYSTNLRGALNGNMDKQVDVLYEIVMSKHE